MSKLLSSLLSSLPPAIASTAPVPSDLEISRLQTDSRKVQPGDLFIGMPGTQADGGTYWPQAAANGAVAAVISHKAFTAIDTDNAPIPLFAWDSELLPELCGDIANDFFDCPSQSLALVGVTGTNGKTTTTHIIEHLLNNGSSRSSSATALVGTLYERWPGHSIEAAHTTPFSPDLQATLAAARGDGCKQAVMEISSHSLHQKRAWGCQFDAAVWTNLTQDHLDYHGTMEAYWEAKALLFKPPYFSSSSRAVLNIDDPWVRRLCDTWPADCLLPWGFTLKSVDDLPSEVQEAWGERLLWASHVAMDAMQIRARLHTPAGEIDIEVPLIGQFNLANLLAAVGVALHLGVSSRSIQSALPSFPGVPGRVAPVQVTSAQDIAVTVDYAHTPDGLRNLLEAVRPSVQNSLICVFGCGGDRDRRKRPLMGQIAAELSDAIVVTSDNPRTEDPQQILNDILEGINPQDTQLTVEVDRKAAITQAILAAKPGDTVAIAGKGHETYQIVGKVKRHFDDREEAEAALKQRLS